MAMVAVQSDVSVASSHEPRSPAANIIDTLDTEPPSPSLTKKLAEKQAEIRRILDSLIESETELFKKKVYAYVPQNQQNASNLDAAFPPLPSGSPEGQQLTPLPEVDISTFDFGKWTSLIDVQE